MTENGMRALIYAQATAASLAPAALLILLAIGSPVSAAHANDKRPITAEQEVELFCTNIADAARDRRYALQAQTLEQLRQQVDARVAVLEKKRAEYQAWFERRETFIAQAEENLVQIYSSMRPDAAAERLAEVRIELAAAILMKLEPRSAGVILNEMDRKAAAIITGVMASASRPEDPS